MKRKRTEIIFLLDRSGSMSGLESDTIGGFNGFIEKQINPNETTILTAVLFDNTYELLWNGVNAEDVRLTEKEYFVRGVTALLDAIGKTILDAGSRISQASEEEMPDEVLFVITTDGLENSSSEFSYDKVKNLIDSYQKKHNWKFIFLGANIDASVEANRIGIDSEDAFAFEASSVGVAKMYDMVHEEIGRRKDF